ncbi:MAG: hypothetical protein ACK4UJ_01860 [Leptonema sp. (in: bacteria)]
MKLVEDSFLFTNLEEFEFFFLQFNLKGILILNRDFIDNAGNVLIRKNAMVRSSFIEKLKQNRGTYEEKFYVKITQPLVEILAEFLSNVIVNDGIKSWDFLDKLYKISLNKPRNIVKNALKFPKLCVGSYILFKKERNQFDYISRIGLLALAVVLLQEVKVKGLYTFTFLAAFVSEFIFTNHTTMMESYDNQYLLKDLVKQSLKLVRRFELPEEVSKILNSIKPLSVISNENISLNKESSEEEKEPSFFFI